MEKVTNSPDYKDMPVDDALADLKYVGANDITKTRYWSI